MDENWKVISINGRGAVAADPEGKVNIPHTQFLLEYVSMRLQLLQSKVAYAQSSVLQFQFEMTSLFTRSSLGNRSR